MNPRSPKKQSDVRIQPCQIQSRIERVLCYFTMQHQTGWSLRLRGCTRSRCRFNNEPSEQRPNRDETRNWVRLRMGNAAIAGQLQPLERHRVP